MSRLDKKTRLTVSLELGKSELEVSRLWLDVEFQHWTGDRDQIAKFSLNEYGHLHGEYFENIDPDDWLIDIKQFNLTRYRPNTARQFLEIISENVPAVLQIPHLCSVSYQGDRDVLSILWDFIDTNIVDETSVPDDEIDFVKASRPHTPKTSTEMVKDLKISRGFDERRILYVGDEEWIISSHEISDVAIPISQLIYCDSEISPYETLLSIDVQSDYGARFRFRLVAISREYSIGFAKFADEEYWFRIPGSPGHAVAVFVAEKVREVFEFSYANPAISIEQFETLLIRNLEHLGGTFSLLSQDASLSLNLGTNGYDISMLASRIRLEREWISALNSCTSFTSDGELSRSLYPVIHESEMYRFRLDIEKSRETEDTAWDIRFSSGLRSFNRRIYQVDSHLVDVLLRIFERETLVLSIVGKSNYKPVELPDSRLDLYYSFSEIELVFVESK